MAVTWLSWGSPALAARPAAPTSLSAAQTAQISKARTQLTTAQSRLDELQRYIASEDWTNTSNFIHGPLGDLRRQAATINRNLLSSKDQQKARSQARELMAHIERLDMAAKDRNARLATKEYGLAVADLSAYLDLVPAVGP